MEEIWPTKEKQRKEEAARRRYSFEKSWKVRMGQKEQLREESAFDEVTQR